jgi:hypothetical protein
MVVVVLQQVPASAGPAQAAAPAMLLLLKFLQALSLAETAAASSAAALAAAVVETEQHALPGSLHKLVALPARLLMLMLPQQHLLPQSESCMLLTAVAARAMQCVSWA